MRKPDGRITASALYDHLILALGTLTEFRAGVSADSTQVTRETLKLAGIDPDNTDLQLTGRDGLNRRVSFAWRNQCLKHCARSRQVYCTKGDQRGLWALTELGAKYAQTLAGNDEQPCEVDLVESVVEQLAAAKAQFLTEHTRQAMSQAVEEAKKPVQKAPSVPTALVPSPVTKKPQRNATAKWVESKGLALIERLRSHLERKMPRSMVMGKVEDHIQTFLTNLIRRDSLAGRIAEGRSIPLSQVCNWCRRSAYSDIRDEGRNPVTRTLHGALTKDEWERVAETEWTREVVPTTINQSDQLSRGSSFGIGDYDPEAVNAMDFLVSPTDVENEYADTRAYQDTMAAIDRAIDAHLEGKDHNIALHKAILRDKFVSRLTLKELADKYNLPKDTTNAMIGRVRKAVRKANDSGKFAFLD